MKRILFNMTATVLLLVLAAPGLAMAGADAGAVKLKIQSDRPFVPAGSEQTVRVKVQVDGVELPQADRPPVNLAIIIDKSGSMGGDRIINARRGAIEAVRRLGRDDIVSLVVFDSEVQTLIPAQRVTDIERIERVINGIHAGGMTNIHGGMVAAHAELSRHLEKGYLNRAVLLSDGQANRGPTRPEDFATLGRRFSSEGMVVSTVGLGHDYNVHLLATLAQASEGNNYFVDNPATLPKIFEQEVGHMVSTVATGVTITIELPAGVRLERVLGRSHRQQERRVEIDFHDLAAGASKYSVLELVVPAGEADAVLGDLEARAGFRRVSDQSTGEAQARTQVRYTASREQAEAAVNVEVQQAWAELHRAEVQEQVLDLVERGEREQARARLESLAHDADAAGIAAPAARALKEYAEQEAQILRERGYSRNEALGRRADSYQTRNQQQAGRHVDAGDSDD